LLVTDKKVTAPLYKSLSLDFQLAFAEAKQKPDFVVDRFKLTKFPALLVFPKDSDEPKPFEGGMFC
jgi:hypothetical protein